jgi:glycosyltransferase involved in cell wall biosynthesis
MRVLFINENIGGHATVHHHLRRALRAHPDVEATFLDVPAPGLTRRVLGAAVPGLGRFDLDLQPLRAQLSLSAWVRRRVARMVHEFDVVHLYTQNAGLLSVSALRRKPLVVSLDTTNAENAYRLPYRAPTRFTPVFVPWSMRLEQRVFAAAHRVIANSNWAARSLFEDYHLAEAKVEILPFGITDPGVVAERPLGRRPRIVFLGRQFERKGGPLLVQAWRRSVADRADLVLVTKDAVPTEPGITVVADLDQGDGRLWEILAQGDLLAFPSTIDQAPNAVIEAMAAGLPVIAVPSAGTAEMVIDHVTGLHVPANDEAAFGDALAALIDDPTRRAAMGAAGRRRFQTVYDARASTSRLVTILREAADSAGPRGR